MIVPFRVVTDRLTRHLIVVTTPALWPAWPFLPLVRCTNTGVQELGVMFDAFATLDMPGYSATVFLTNLFEMPSCYDQLLVMPREVYDTGEELVTAGWRVD